ncbi:hypothetical protein [Psychrobacter sp.]|uniref:hypothetical protein n=1 Tax=Psychrobacter sp. TaxID=56811 RepID=UPI003F9DE2AF
MALSTESLAQQNMSEPNQAQSDDDLPPLKTETETLVVNETTAATITATNTDTQSQESVSTTEESEGNRTDAAAERVMPAQQPTTSAQQSRLQQTEPSDTTVSGVEPDTESEIDSDTETSKITTGQSKRKEREEAVRKSAADVEAAINSASLLARDVPTQNTNVELDTDYQAAKSEVEEANNRLSDAINSVKRQNQQKIEALQQQRESSATNQAESSNQDIESRQ